MKNYAIKATEWLVLSVILLFMTGCSGRGTKVVLSGEEVYGRKAASGFSIYGTDGASTVLEIKNPWQGAEGVATQVFISRGGESAPKDFNGVVVTAPVRRAVCFSSTHIAFMDAL